MPSPANIVGYLGVFVLGLWLGYQLTKRIR